MTEMSLFTKTRKHENTKTRKHENIARPSRRWPRTRRSENLCERRTFGALQLPTLSRLLQKRRTFSALFGADENQKNLRSKRRSHSRSSTKKHFGVFFRAFSFSCFRDSFLVAAMPRREIRGQSSANHVVRPTNGF